MLPEKKLRSTLRLAVTATAKNDRAKLLQQRNRCFNTRLHIAPAGCNLQAHLTPLQQKYFDSGSLVPLPLYAAQPLQSCS